MSLRLEKREDLMPGAGRDDTRGVISILLCLIYWTVQVSLRQHELKYFYAQIILSPHASQYHYPPPVCLSEISYGGPCLQYFRY